jgi:pilus assembly protein CpaE
VHRHGPDDGGTVISRRILVISRSPALSRAIQASLGHGYEVVTSANVVDVVDEVRELGPFGVLVAGPVFDSHAGMARLAALRAAGAVPALVLALGPRPRANLSDIVRTGAVELVEYPTSKGQLSSALQRAFDIADVSAANGEPVLPVVAHGVVVDRPQFAEVFTVASSSGGCGKTFYATNLACYLAAQTGQRVCLVDLDLQFGEVSTALHLRPRFTISDLLSREPVDEDDLDEHVEEYLEEHELGFSVLAAPFSPADADMIAPKDVYKVMGALRRHFDYVVVDTPAQLSEIVLAAFDHSTRVLCMVTLDLPSIRNMRVFLTTLEKLRINSQTIGVVLNKVEDDIGIDINDVQEVLDNKIVSILPYSREVMRSINKGKPALVSAANSEIGKKLAGGMQQFLSDETTPTLASGPNTAEIGATRGFWRRRKGRANKVPELERV